MSLKQDKKLIPVRHSITIPKWSKTFSNVLMGFLGFAILLLVLTPWVQTSQGTGRVIALDPNDRVQNISANVSGVVKKWYVKDGTKVYEGDPIVELMDNDPLIIERLKAETESIKFRYEAALEASKTALKNYDRQGKLLKDGLSSERQYEKAKIEYKKLLSKKAEAYADLKKAEIKVSRQNTLLIRAPKDGTILQVLPGSGSVFIKTGQVLASFVPDFYDLAAEVYVDGNDLPLINPGRTVRLQFEGWPAVQFSGWPSVAVGTFSGKVHKVDPTVSSNGKFRIIVTPEDQYNWPDRQYLRQGARVYGWVLLNTVKLGYELWRQFNGFPASYDGEPLNLNQTSRSISSDEVKKEKKTKSKDRTKELFK